jgi:hypothetical protein
VYVSLFVPWNMVLFSKEFGSPLTCSTKKLDVTKLFEFDGVNK